MYKRQVYTTLAAADLRIAVTGCTVSALEPSAAVSVLYKDEIDASDNIIAATKAKTAAYTAEVCSCLLYTSWPTRSFSSMKR